MLYTADNILFFFQIDSNVVLMMTIDQLEPYVPAFRDRIALMSYCRRTRETKNTSKPGLLTKLMRKLKQKKSGSESDSETDIKSNKGNAKHTYLLGNSFASKKNRRVDLGWQHYDLNSKQYRQVKEKTGGGIRRLEVSKDTKGEQLLKTAIEIFFQDGQTPHGSISDFDFELKDFKQGKVDLKNSVNEIYEATHVKLLRLYLCTKIKTQDDLPILSKPCTTCTMEELPTPIEPTHMLNDIKPGKLESACRDVGKSLQAISTSAALSQNVTLTMQSSPLSVDIKSANLDNTCRDGVNSFQTTGIPASPFTQNVTLPISVEPDNSYSPELPEILFQDSITSRSSTISIDECSLADVSDLIVFGPSETVTSDMLSEPIKLDSGKSEPPRSPSPLLYLLIL